jgi:outer membrane protein W
MATFPTAGSRAPDEIHAVIQRGQPQRWQTMTTGQEARVNGVSRKAGLLALVALAGAHVHASAQVTFDLQVSPMMTGTFFLSDPPSRFAIERQGATPLIIRSGEFGHAVGVGIDAGVLIARDFGIQAMFWWIPTELSADEGLFEYGDQVEVNTLMYGLTAVYYFPHIASKLEPFVGVGLGAETMGYDPQFAWQRHTDFMTHAVVGGHLWLTDQLALRLEGRDCLTRFRSHVEGVGSSNEHDLMISAGLTFRAPLAR